MSDLLTNLNSIYTTKLQIKEAIGTSSDVFADYPGYISSMVLPDGTAYITENGVSDISSYQYVDVSVPSGPTPTGTYNITDNGTYDVTTYASAYVNVPQGGGVDYQWIDPASYTMVIGEKYAFNGQLSTNAQTQITSQFVEMYPALAPYLNWYVYGIGGENNSNNWSKTAIIETPGDLPGSGVIVKGTWSEPITGNPMFIVDELYAAKYAGGNGGLTIQSNGNQDVTKYSYVNVSVSGGVDYQWIDLDVDTKTTGSYYEFNGQLNSNYMMQITSEFAQEYPALEPYIGWYVYTINGEDNISDPQSTGQWSETCIIENTYGLDGLAVVAKGQYVELITGNPMFVIDSLEAAKYAGGNGTLNIISNGTQSVVRYQSVNVNVSPTPYLFGGIEYLAAYNTYTGETTIIEGNGDTDQSFVLPLNFNVSVSESSVDVTISDSYKLSFYYSDGDVGFNIPFVPFGGDESQFDGVTFTPGENSITITYNNVSQNFNYDYNDSNFFGIVTVVNAGSTIDSSSIYFETDYVESGSIYERLSAVKFIVTHNGADNSITWSMAYELSPVE